MINSDEQSAKFGQFSKIPKSKPPPSLQALPTSPILDLRQKRGQENSKKLANFHIFHTQLAGIKF